MHVVAFILICVVHPEHSTAQPGYFQNPNLWLLSPEIMKIKEIRTRVVQWRGKTVPLPPHFCTNPMDCSRPC